MLERLIGKHSTKVAVGLLLTFITFSVGWDFNTTNVGKKDKKESKNNGGGCSRKERSIQNVDTKEEISLKKVIEDYGTRSEIKYNLIAPVNSSYSNIKDEYIWDNASQVSNGFVVTCKGNIQHSSMMDSADGMKQVFLVPHLLKMNKENKKELDAYIFFDEDFYKNIKNGEIVYGCSRGNLTYKAEKIKLDGKKINGIYSHHLKFIYDSDKTGFFQIRGDDSNKEYTFAIAQEK